MLKENEMAKYKINKNELIEHWNNQIRFIQKSINEFDAGDEAEAQRMATHLRIMFHETKNSKSIFGQLKLPIIFYSGTSLYTPSNLLSSWTLLSIQVNSEGMRYSSELDDTSRIFFLTFTDWWNEIIFDDRDNKFSRCDIVTFIANQDGGAHVDAKLNEAYAKLTKMNSLGWTDYSGRSPVNNPAYQAIRAIAREVMISIELSQYALKSRKKQKEKTFEMRIVDDRGRRYKWSTTEISCSPETLNIVSQDRAEKRTLYTDEYSNGMKIEYIGN